MLTVDQMTFGVEIECYVPHQALQEAGWRVGGYHRGVLLPGDQGTRHGWNVQADCSVSSGNPDVTRYVAVEVVSGKLQGEDGLASLVAVVTELNRMGAIVNSHCGLHVHVGCAEDLQVIRRLIYLCASHETALYAQTGTRQRERGAYCKSAKQCLAGLKDRDVSRDLLRRVAGSDRYCLLNLTNIIGGTRPAVEFRCFAGTVNLTKITGHLFVCLGLVQKAHNQHVTAPWDAPPKKERAIYQGKGPGYIAVDRLLWCLGWSNKSKTLGVIGGNQQLRGIRQKLLALATKYDGQP